jgi:hypothetical protein
VVKSSAHKPLRDRVNDLKDGAIQPLTAAEPNGLWGDGRPSGREIYGAQDCF